VSGVAAQARLALGSAAALAAVAALVTAAWWLAGRPEEAARRAREAARPLPFSPAAVAEVRIEGGPAGAQVRLVRGRPGWRVAAPAEGPADGEAVERLLAALSAVRPRATVEQPASTLGAVGLDPPRARVTLVLERGASLVLDLGDDHPFDRSVHARVRRERRPEEASPAGAGAAVELLLLPPGSRQLLAPGLEALRGPTGPGGAGAPDGALR
jgi:hypothetical protein